MLKKTLLLSLSATLLLATNGVNMVGTSTVSRSMGGTGVAFYSHATEAMHKNISMLGDIEKDEFQFDMTIFSATVNSTVYDKMPLNANLVLPNLPSYDNPITATSANMFDTNFIPSMTYATRIFDELVFGFAIIGAAGMATQYEGEYSQRQLNSSMLLMKIIPGFSYRQGNTTFGFAPVLGLGSLSLNYDDRYLDESGNSYDYGTKPQSQREGIFGTNVGGSELESAIGYTVGMDVKVTPKLRIGATYNSALKNTYREVANFSQFGPNGMVYMADEWMRNNTGAGLTTGDVSTIGVQLMDNVAFSTIPNAQDIADTIQKLSGAGSITDALAATNPDHRDDLTMEQPWEIAVGFAYDISNKMVVTFDYRYIAWGTAEGYRDFGWDSQHVYAFGMQHTGKDYVLRAGYSYADSPIPNTTDEFGAVLTDVQGTLVFKQAVSMLNMVGFPAISTTHFSVGGGYAFDEDIDFDLAMMYSPTATATRSGSLNPVELGFEAVDMPYEYQTTMQQLSLSFGINYKF